MTTEYKTPCEKLGYRVGDVFEVKESVYPYNKGDIITLVKDDDTTCPYFRRVWDDNFSFCLLENLRKVTNKQYIVAVIKDEGQVYNNIEDARAFAELNTRVGERVVIAEVVDVLELKAEYIWSDKV